ncbi:SCO family protein [Actomonas aquatica]|uniref:SCO family protein n=1 Tax=Actomonas aquatica TaxID=2866162 RepID=A0ABZ1CCP2_9BACT|nr:SCO family protein [Opitutus sp. WL0086]WRQ89444.1 SCO family protein [Opitutus sp. WL0086]
MTSKIAGFSCCVRRWLGVSLVTTALLLTACNRAEKAAQPERLPVPGRPLTGQIVKVDLERGTLLVDHDPIPDYMPQMVMEFQAGAGDLANLEAGQRIRARLIEEANGVFRLAHIWVQDGLSESQIAAAAAELHEDTVIRGSKVYRAVGENLPDFSLYDQSGQVVDMNRFRGKKVVINFIYTRCPIATMCPAAVTNMMTVQEGVAAAGKSDQLELISVTFDPEYDTPGVLRDYAAARGIDTSNYSFLTGPESAIKDLLRQLGVLAEVEGPLIQHTLATLLVNEEGRIIDRADGSRWDTQQFVRKIVR